MDPFTQNTSVWSNIYESGKSNLSFPNDNLVRLTNRLFAKQNIQGKKLLDYGFGSGNNLKFFYDLGFDVYGLEISPAAKSMALAKLGSSFFAEHLVVAEARKLLPFADAEFDVVVSWQVLYYNSLESLKQVLGELERVLKPGGTAIFTMCRADDISAAHSKPVGNGERIIDERTPTQTGAHIVVLENEHDLRQVFGMFHDLEVGYFVSNMLGVNSAHWIIYGTK